MLDVSESYPQDQATWRTAPVTAGPADTSPFQLPPEFYDAEPAGGGPTPPDRRNKLLLQGLGLVAVAVLSGLVFWGVQPTHVAGVAEAASGQVNSAGKYTFTRVAGPATDTNCAQHAFSQTQKFLQEHPCQQLIRVAGNPPDRPARRHRRRGVHRRREDARSSAGAEQLRRITSSDNTGNVYDHCSRTAALRCPACPPLPSSRTVATPPPPTATSPPSR